MTLFISSVAGRGGPSDIEELKISDPVVVAGISQVADNGIGVSGRWIQGRKVKKDEKKDEDKQFKTPASAHHKKILPLYRGAE